MPSIPTEPEDYARALLARFALTRVHDLPNLAAKLGLEIREVESEGFEGALIRKPTSPKGIIALKKSISETGRRRFTIAHEIGHYILPNHRILEHCKSKDIESHSSFMPVVETEANRFASELLMPVSQVYPLVKSSLATFATAKMIATDFNTSLTAAALKCIDLTEERCALIQTTNGLIDWVWRSNSFGYFISKNHRLHPESLASRLIVTKEDRELSGSVVSGFWIDDVSPQRNERVWEDSIYLPNYSRVLTMVTITE